MLAYYFRSGFVELPINYGCAYGGKTDNKRNQTQVL